MLRSRPHLLPVLRTELGRHEQFSHNQFNDTSVQSNAFTQLVCTVRPTISFFSNRMQCTTDWLHALGSICQQSQFFFWADSPIYIGRLSNMQQQQKLAFALFPPNVGGKLFSADTYTELPSPSTSRTPKVKKTVIVCWKSSQDSSFNQPMNQAQRVLGKIRYKK